MNFEKSKIRRLLIFLADNPSEALNWILHPKSLMNRLFLMLNLNYQMVNLESIILYVNNTCNLKCMMCDIGQGNMLGIDKLREKQKNSVLQLELLEKLLNDPYIKNKKIRFNLLMTEPLLHPKITEIAGRIKEKGHYLNLTTNGRLLPEKAQSLGEAGLDCIQVSIDGPARLNDKIRGVKSTYKNAIKGLRALSSFKTKKIINYTVSCLNDRQILGFLRGLDKEGIPIDLVKFQFMDFVSEEMAEAQNSNCEFKQSMSCISENVSPQKVNAKELSRQLKIIKEKKFKNIRRINIVPYLVEEEEIEKYFSVAGKKIKGNDKCFYPWRQFAFTTDGKVLIHMRCFDYVYGDLTKNPIKGIFHNKKISDFRKKLAASGFCFPACTRCCGVMRFGFGPK